MPKINKNYQGFTLIELLVVVAIIGLLSTLSIIALNSARSKARDARRLADVNAIRTALELYYSDHGYYPKFQSMTHCSVENNNALGILETELATSKVPKDPKFSQNGTYYQCYNYTGVGDDTSYPSATGLRCNGRLRTDYYWVLLFSTESASYSDKFEPSGTNYRYCIHGDLLPGL